jgi:hypothetical protein
MHEQQRIRQSSKMVEDSLYALAKRQQSISSYVTKQINDINKYLGKSLNDMEDRNKMRAAGNQQFVMTGYNNLALQLSEALQQVQQQMSQDQKGGDPSSSPKMCMKCNKPGQGKPSLSKMQQQLKDKISQASEMMKKDGQQKGPGQQGQGQPSSAMSKEFAEMAQMQAQIRREMEKAYMQGKDGSKPGSDWGQIKKDMEETEKQLVNKQLTTEMLTRQQQILDKLLQAENAERQKDEEQKRESHTGKDVKREVPPAIEAYLKAKSSEVDLYKTVPPTLKPYYKTLAEKYFRSLTIQQ